jgi:hypothetical protein
MGTLGTKGALGYLLGLFSKKGMEELELFGHIRNRFAHFHKPLDFSDANIKDWVKAIKVQSRIGFPIKPAGGQWDRNALRYHFIVSLEIFSSILHQLVEGYQGHNPL